MPCIQGSAAKYSHGLDSQLGSSPLSGACGATKEDIYQLERSHLTGPVPLRTGAATPQGDPFGPFLMALWVQWGKANVDANTARRNGVRPAQRYYMDDRTWAAGSPAALLEVKTAWERWSALVAMRENRRKTQLTAYHHGGKLALTHAAEQQDCATKVVDGLGHWG